MLNHDVAAFETQQCVPMFEKSEYQKLNIEVRVGARPSGPEAQEPPAATIATADTRAAAWRVGRHRRGWSSGTDPGRWVPGDETPHPPPI